MATTLRSKKKRELFNIDCREVSLVDRAATGRKFLFIKNLEGRPVDRDGMVEISPEELAAIIAAAIKQALGR